ncbi:unnamed protein product, partial [Fusarium graminearum]
FPVFAFHALSYSFSRLFTTLIKITARDLPYKPVAGASLSSKEQKELLPQLKPTKDLPAYHLPYYHKRSNTYRVSDFPHSPSKLFLFILTLFSVYPPFAFVHDRSLSL